MQPWNRLRLRPLVTVQVVDVPETTLGPDVKNDPQCSVAASLAASTCWTGVPGAAAADQFGLE